MANTQSAQKALRSSEKKRTVNNARKNRIRTFIRKVADSIKAGNQKQAFADLNNLESEIMRGVTKKVIKLNTASRKLSRLSKQIRKIETKKSA